MSDDLREQIIERAALAFLASQQTAWEDWDITPRQWATGLADAVLTLPAMSDLLALRQRMERLAEEFDHWGDRLRGAAVANRIRAALGEP